MNPHLRPTRNATINVPNDCVYVPYKKVLVKERNNWSGSRTHRHTYKQIWSFQVFRHTSHCTQFQSLPLSICQTISWCLGASEGNKQCSRHCSSSSSRRKTNCENYNTWRLKADFYCNTVHDYCMRHWRSLEIRGQCWFAHFTHLLKIQQSVHKVFLCFGILKFSHVLSCL